MHKQTHSPTNNPKRGHALQALLATHIQADHKHTDLQASRPRSNASEDLRFLGEPPDPGIGDRAIPGWRWRESRHSALPDMRMGEPPPPEEWPTTRRRPVINPDNGTKVFFLTDFFLKYC